MKYILLGNHPSIEKIRELITVVSDTALNVLITGETGTGKEVVARLLHYTSPRRSRKFVKVNCAALPLTLLESELFGYEKGAFTGADKFKPGKFEIASGGLIFLDEIGDMPPVLQAKLLQVLQSGEFTRLGGTQEVKVNAWVVAATNHDLDHDMQKGKFREDLFYRLNIIRIDIPPLRDRREDIGLLADHFIQKYRTELKIKERYKLDGGLMKLFMEYHWPGNVRELSSTVLRLLVGEDPESIYEEFSRNMEADGFRQPESSMEVPEDIVAPPSEREEAAGKEAISLKELKERVTRQIEKRVILYALESSNWNKTKASRVLKISYKTLFYKMKELGIGQKMSNDQSQRRQNAGDRSHK
ncbi:MAG: sigma-54-dependent Fis family transcriptional regulator [Deltaproteobacteria bacterium]|nr:sigma-54-dependent Fis family transcriptional regulator [Deltaproteobacteria bacterium]HDM10208.1 sigma-54-dependent Fis family transcriptional regulator [Desulfobacteraceae bacterium]